MGKMKGWPEIQNKGKCRELYFRGEKKRKKNINKTDNNDRYSNTAGKDLEITVNHKPVRSQQCDALVNKTKTTGRRLLSSAKVLVKAHLEDSAHFQALHLKKAVGKFKVKVTIRVRGLEDITNNRNWIAWSKRGRLRWEQIKSPLQQDCYRKTDSLEEIENIIF